MESQIKNTRMNDQHHPIRIVIADDHEMVRFGLKLLLDSREDFVCVGEARDGYEAIDLCRQVKPDLILMDIKMPGLDGIQATKIIKEEHPDTVVLALSAIKQPQIVQEILAVGAEELISKHVSNNELLLAIKGSLA